MEEKADPEPSDDDGVDRERELSALTDNRLPRGIGLGFDSLPESIGRLVGDYMSHNAKDPMKLALFGERRITLCLSQHAKLELGPCWRVGCLTPEERWEPSMDVTAVKKSLIKNDQSCFEFLSRKNSAYYPIFIEVLVFQLDTLSKDFLSAVDDLERTFVVLREHLISVQHVVFAVGKYCFCCYSFKDDIADSTGLRQTVERLPVLLQILVDLRACWTASHRLTAKELIHFYCQNETKPVSEKHLSKLVVLLNNDQNATVYDTSDPTLKSSKLMWICYFDTLDDFLWYRRFLIRSCHAVYMDASKCVERDNIAMLLRQERPFQDNPLIERIAVNTGTDLTIMKLPTPSAPFTDASPLFPLVELTLEGDHNDIDLTQLNQGCFKNLTRLSIIGGYILGQLDSHHLPRLKTLILEPGTRVDRPRSKVETLLREHAQSLIDTGRPWQVIATRRQGGWSLASYGELITHSQIEAKDDSPNFPVDSTPRICELMLVMRTQQDANDWQSRLTGSPFPEVANKGHRNEPLLWSPEYVQSITLFSTAEKSAVPFEFIEAIPSKIRVLRFLTCHDVNIFLNGAVLPDLKSFKMYGGKVRLEGAFPQLEMLSFEKTHFDLLWKINAPLLKSLHCHTLINFGDLLVYPALLPQLSFLHIDSSDEHDKEYPTIMDSDGSQGLSQVKEVFFGKKMEVLSNCDQYQLYNVLHLELSVNVLNLPKFWFDTEWRCETLTINFFKNDLVNFDGQGALAVKLPQLLPFVEKLTVTEQDCKVLLDSEMPSLMECTVPSPESLGPNMFCRLLERIRFTDELSASDKRKCLDRATYEAIGAQPRDVIFSFHYEFQTMAWGVVLNENESMFFDRLLEEDDHS